MYQCPRCTADLATVDYAGVEIETCPACRGEWLDADELRQIVQQAEARFEPEEIVQLNQARADLFRARPIEVERMVCPKCPGIGLRAFNYAATSGIILDKCPSCGGIWLDHGEMEMVQALVDEWKGYLYERQSGGRALAAKLEPDEARPGPNPKTDSKVSFAVAVLRWFSGP
jgi:Zn-finger nucleic acid-binding protein